MDLALHYQLRNDEIFMANADQCESDEEEQVASLETLGQQCHEIRGQPLAMGVGLCCGVDLSAGELRLGEVTEGWIERFRKL